MARRVLLAEVGERTLWDRTRFGGNNAGGASGQTIYFNSPNLEVAKNAYRFAGMLYPDVGNVFSITPRAGGRLLFAVRATTLQDNGAYIGVCTQAFGVDTVPGFNGSGSPDNESWSIHTGGFSAGAGASYHGGVSGGGYTGTSMLTGEYVLVAVDLDQGKIWFGKATDIGGAPTWFYSGNPSTDTSPKYTNLLTAGSITDNRSTLLPGTKRAFYIVASAQDPNSIVHLVTDEPSLRSWLPTGFTPWGELGYFGSEGYTSRETDTPKSRYYDGRIADDADPVYERTVSVAQWSTGGSGGAPIGTFDLENPDGGLDALLTYVVRDAPIRWRLGDPAASLSTFTDVGYGVVETIEVADESRLTVVTKDTLAVVDLVLLLQATQDGDRVLHGRLGDEDGLEAPRQGGVLLYVLAVLVEGGGAHAVQLAPRQGRLEQVGGIHGAIGLPGAHQGMHFVDEEDDGALGGGDLVQDRLQPLFELTPVLRPGDQGAHVEGEQLLVLQALRHIAIDDALGQALDDGGLADPGLADQDRVVLGPPRQDLDGPADLFIAADHRVDLSVSGGQGQVAGIALEGVIALLGRGAVGGLALAQGLGGLLQSGLFGAGLAQDAGDLAAFLGDGDQEAFGGDKGVSGGLGAGLGCGEDAGGFRGQVDLARPALDARAFCQESVHRLVDGVGPSASALDQGAGEPVLLLKEDLEKVLGRKLLVTTGQGEALGRLDGLLGAVGILVDVHVSPREAEFRRSP